MRNQLTIQVDQVAEAAYVRMSMEPVVRTVTHDDAINIDLDRFGMVVGIEVLQLSAPLPFGDLVTRYHVDSALVDLLRQLQPSISSFVTRFTTDGAGAARAEVKDTVPC